MGDHHRLDGVRPLLLLLLLLLRSRWGMVLGMSVGDRWGGIHVTSRGGKRGRRRTGTALGLRAGSSGGGGLILMG